MKSKIKEKNRLSSLCTVNPRKDDIEIVESETGLVPGPRHHNVPVGFGTKNRPKQHSLPASQCSFKSTSSQKL